MSQQIPTLPALSIRQPWAWLILHSGKDIENRTWRTNYRGEFLIHASKGFTIKEFNEGIYFAFGTLPPDGPEKCLRIPSPKEIALGGIVGIAEIVDCVDESKSPWFVGPHGFVLANARPLPFTPCKGRLGFFRSTETIEK